MSRRYTGITKNVGTIFSRRPKANILHGGYIQSLIVYKKLQKSIFRRKDKGVP